jgi:hypothetical protein
MRITDAYRALLIAGIASVAVTLMIDTADAAKATAKGGRDAAIEKCFAEARASAETPVGGGGGERRAAVYKDCMTKSGYRP